ncbi:hypothetical protein PVL29_018637 [Vitis rotundifolia]|uniref:Uncharacterized protein n=1 Tax=Vitis rotundifolia TaxID=103349 RepID=A0AA39DG54_VITRO|nr:hypothetical protein PVL29_018637 [Vitis rotundifolia]
MKSTTKPVQAPQGYSSTPYVGASAPFSMYLGVPPYGFSLFNGAPILFYDAYFSRGSTYHYNYGSCLSASNPYRPLHLSGPPPYSSESMIGNGEMYGMPPLVDYYGLGLPMGHATTFLKIPSSNKNSKIDYESLWKCHHDI